MNIIPHANQEVMACCCHNFNSFTLMASLRKRVVFLNYFSRTQLFPGLWIIWLPNAPKAILPLF